MASNGPNLNPKQQELVERLERIRQRRAATGQGESPKREEQSVERPVPTRSEQAPSRRRRNEQAPSPTRRNEQAPRRSGGNQDTRPVERKTIQPRTRSAAPNRRNEKPVGERGRRSPINENTRTLKEQRQRFSSEDYAALRAEIKAGSRQEQVRKTAAKRKKAQRQNHLIKQLSDGNKLADAIILSEILSKSVALRKK